ncbi:hypothetical protein B0H13DRAFT_1592466 [Mycena leptocephala]|nr:hypothetical protein B0H13DRAFT_1592466 [Mycena leptocephala]
MNPFSQGWIPIPNTAPTPSVFSVLPTLPYTGQPNTSPNVIKFTFSPSNGTVLNSFINGPQLEFYFHVTTDSTTTGFSVVQNSTCESIAMIEWHNHPIVEIFGGIVSKRNSAQWLKLSRDKTHRLMSFGGRNYIWSPEEHASPTSRQFFGRISQGQDGTAFEVTPEALQFGLLEIFVVASLLLMCGRNIH